MHLLLAALYNSFAITVWTSDWIFSHPQAVINKIFCYTKYTLRTFKFPDSPHLCPLSCFDKFKMFVLCTICSHFHIVQLGQDNDLSEFDESRDIIESLVDEYKACESPDYIKWGMEVHLLLV